jgi:tetratricopeptide (TPR) repeat protein
MDFSDQLRVLQAAKGDPAKLALATVDLAYASLPDAERTALRQSLQAAAIPHWCDEAILAALLEIPKQESAARLARLRGLNVVEPFPARGENTMNVHEATRLALRAKLHVEDPEGLRALSARAQAHFAKDNAAHAVVEALYQRFIAEPEIAERECRKLYRRLSDATEYDSLLALGAILAELLDSEQPGLPPGLVRGTALLCLSRIRRNYPRLEDREGTTVTLAREALGEYQAVAAEGWIIAMAYQNLGNALGEQGDLDAALNERRAGLEVEKALAQANPSDARQKHKLSVAYNKLGRILRLKGDFAGALDSYHKNLDIAAPLAKQNPDNSRLQSHLAVSQDDLGDALRDQGQLRETLEQYRAALAIREDLVVHEPDTYNWQLDVFESLTKIGNVLRDQGELRSALSSYSNALDIIKPLANRYITNARWQNDLASACAKVADVLLRLPDGKRAEALELIRQGQERIEALARSHPLTQREQKVRAHLERLAARAGEESPGSVSDLGP